MPSTFFPRLKLDWLTFKERNEGRAPSTVNKYAQTLERFGSYCEARGIDPLKISAEDLAGFAGVGLHEMGIKPRARRPMVSALRGFFAWCHESGVIESNPAAGLPLPAAGQPLPAALTLTDAELLIMAPGMRDFTGVRDTALIAVMLGTGARIGGLEGMNESSLIWTREAEREQLTVKVTEKGRKDRLLPVSEEARLLVRAYLGHPDLMAIDRTLPNGDRVLWCSVGNRQITIDKYHGEERRLKARGIDRIIKRHGLAVGIPVERLHVHAARHLVGVELAESGADTLTIQAILGHTDPRATEIYTRMAARKLRQATEQSSPLRKIQTPVSDLIKHTSKRASFGVG